MAVKFDYLPSSGLFSSMTFGIVEEEEEEEEVKNKKIGETQTYTYFPSTEKVSSILSFDQVRSDFTYFGLDRIASEGQTIDGDSYKVNLIFDKFFRPIRQTLTSNGGQVSRTDLSYRKDSQLSKIGPMILNYDSTSGRLKSTSLGKIRNSRTYDSFGNLKTYRSAFYPSTKCAAEVDMSCAQEFYSYRLTRDLMGRITTKVETIQGQTTSFEYSYDSSGRLSSVTKNGVIDSSFVYDLNGNRVSGTQNGEAFTASFDDQDRMTSYSQGPEFGKTFTYNLNGELIQINQGSEITTFSPDILGRLKSVDLPNLNTVDYKLDHEGRRAQKLVNGVASLRTVFEDTFRVAAEIGSEGVREYIYGTNINSADYMRVGTDFFRIIKDHLGSPRLVVNAKTGSAVQRMDYNEWGKVILDTNPGFQGFGFAGGLYDPDTQLVKFGARDYDGSTGRWLTKDPILFNGGDTNLYGYVLQDPVNLIDPKGTWPEWLDDGVCHITGRCDPSDADSDDWSDTIGDIIADIFPHDDSSDDAQGNYCAD